MTRTLHVRIRRAPHAPLARPRLHPMECRCHRCEPLRAAQVHQLNQLARLTLAGLMLGIAAIWLLDRAIGGPGIFSIFGVNL